MSGQLERFDPSSERGRLAYEHLHRYAICRDCVAGKRVLDIACGTGYGTSILGGMAATVTGVDIDAAAIKSAKAKFASTNVNFVVGDCYNLPFDDGSFDIVVANEMIEHVEDHGGLLREAKRALRKNGILLVSTPNKPVYNRYKTPNVFHVSEMELGEFRRTLERHFKHVELIGLRMALLSVGFDLEQKSDFSNIPSAQVYRGEFDSGHPSIESDAMNLREPEYAVAICSDVPIELLPQRASLFYSREDDLWLEHEKIMAWASQLHNEDEALRADLARVRLKLETADAVVQANEQERSLFKDQMGVLNEAVSALGKGLDRQSQTAAREIEAQLLTVTRLLGRMIDSEVANDLGSAVEAVFVLNTRLVEQTARIAELQKVEARASGAEAELARARSELDAALSRAENFAADIDAARQELSSHSDNLTRSESEVERQREGISQLESQLASSLARIDELEGEVIAAENLKQEMTAALEAKAGAEMRLREATARIAELEPRAASPDMAAAKAPSDQPQRRTISHDRVQAQKSDRFVNFHREVRSQLSKAPLAIADRKPTPLLRRQQGRRPRLTNRAPFGTLIYDADWIKQQVPDAGKVTLARYLREERFNLVDPHPLFSAKGYLQANVDVAASGSNPLQHYYEHGWREGRNPHPYFRNDWYLARNPDVLVAGNLNPLDHYLRFGWREGRWPNPVFDPRAYLDRYPDVDQNGMEPLTHYVVHGQAEGRELTLGAVASDWQSLVPADARNAKLIDYLLNVDPPASAIGSAVQPKQQHAEWPPAPLADYWLPQKLRDHLIQGHGEELVDLYWFLCSVMEQYGARPKEFEKSLACQQIVARLKVGSRNQLKTQNSMIGATIIVPVFNNVLDTLLCLATIIETSHEQSYEIIVADDGSTDATQELVSEIGGVVKLLHQSTNLGFVGNCNSAAKCAVGQFIILLNNDTLVFPRWLDGILQPFELDEKVGLVGSKLLNRDGTLQEAGGILWNDGSAWNFGRGQDPRAPEFNYLKDVDYCSGAAIVTPASLWRELKGFDETFAPAYCEDSDLAFRIRAAGYRTVMNPESEVLHHEGRSHGRDINSGIKSHQLFNQQRLFDRWREVLERDHYPNAKNVFRARDRSRRKRHILVIDHYVPQWDRDAGSRTIFEFLKALLEDDWAVTFWPDNLYRDPEYTPGLQSIGVEVIYGPRFACKFEQFLEDREGLYDAVLLSRPHISQHYIEPVRRLTGARILYYGHDVHFVRMEDQAKLGDGSVDQAEIEQMKVMELGVCKACDVVLYPSREEAELMSGLLGQKTKSLSVPAYRFSDDDLAKSQSSLERLKREKDGPLRLLFVGGFAHRPNVDGILWFCRDVVPILRDKGIAFKLEIAGSNATADVWTLQSDDVKVLGFVSDEQLLDLYGHADIVVAPLRYGAGVKGKVIEAMARGVPVVTTDVGAQGIEKADRHLFLGTDAFAFVEAIERAAHPEAAVEKARSAINYVSRNYSTETIRRVFRKALPKR